MSINTDSDSDDLSGVNIAVVTNVAWNLHNFRRPLMRALSAAGANVTAFAPADHTTDQLRDEGFELVDLERLSRKSMNPWHDLNLIRELRRNYRQHKIDVALHFTPKATIYGSIASHGCQTIPISTITGLGYSFLGKSWLREIATRLYRYGLRKAPMTIFQNTDDQNLFISRKIVDQQKTVIVPGSGIDSEYFNPASVENKPEPRSGIHFLFVGRLLTDKGIREFLDAAQIHLDSYPSSQFHIVGSTDDGNPASLSSDEVAIWKSRSGFTFHGTSNEIRSHLADCDALVLPSYREGLPRVVLEGMSMAKPCIVTDVPGCRAAVEHRVTGIMAAVRDAEALAKAFKQFAESTDEQQRAMGQAGRQRVLNTFSDTIITGLYRKIVNEVLSRPSV